MNAPGVSVVIPNYNHARFLDRRIRSVLGQTHGDMEVVILDDHSADESLEVIARYRGDPRVRVILGERNSGSVYAQWNKGIRAATGRYVWIAESDDVAQPRFLETLVAALDSDPSVLLAGCNSWLVDEEDTRLASAMEWNEPLCGGRWGRDFVASGVEECARYLFVANTMPNASAVVFRRSACLEAGLADESFRIAGDWDLWTRIALRGKVAHVAAHLNLFRRHGASTSARVPFMLYFEEATRVRARIESCSRIPPQARAAAMARALRLWRDEARYGDPPPTWADAMRLAQRTRRLHAGLPHRLIGAFLFVRLRRTRLGTTAVAAARIGRRFLRLLASRSPA